MRVARPAGSARSYHGRPALTRAQIGRRIAALLRDGRTADGYRIDEVASGFTPAEVIALTGMTVSVASGAGVMQERW